MAHYVDGFVIPVPKKKLGAYLKQAKQGAKMWLKAGALQYYECVGDDLNSGMGMSFPKGIKTKPGETVVFAWIVYKSRADRDRVNKKVMAQMNPDDFGDMPFDTGRMLYGGFKTIVEG